MENDGRMEGWMNEKMDGRMDERKVAEAEKFTHLGILQLFTPISYNMF